jgi:hypothetical protein
LSKVSDHLIDRLLFSHRLLSKRCLDHLLRHICPLCRSRFSPQEVRRLHIDLQSPTATTASIEEVTETPEPPTSLPDDEARILQNDIARVVKEGAKLPELRRVIEKCRVYYKSQSADQVCCSCCHTVFSPNYIRFYVISRIL